MSLEIRYLFYFHQNFSSFDRQNTTYYFVSSFTRCLFSRVWRRAAVMNGGTKKIKIKQNFTYMWVKILPLIFHTLMRNGSILPLLEKRLWSRSSEKQSQETEMNWDVLKGYICKLMLNWPPSVQMVLCAGPKLVKSVTLVVLGLKTGRQAGMKHRTAADIFNACWKKYMWHITKLRHNPT